MSARAIPATDARMGTLGRRVARLVIEASVKEPRLARLVACLEQTQAPRTATGGDARLESLAGAGRAPLPGPPEMPPQDGSLAALLERRHRTQAGRIEASGERLHRSCGELAQGLARLEAQLGSIESQVLESVQFDPSRAALARRPVDTLREVAPPMQDQPRRASGRRLAPLMYFVLGFTLAASLLVAVYRYPPAALSSAVESATPAPVAQTPWERLWSRALTQPVLGCRETPGAQTFVACVCPRAPPQETGRRCVLGPAWPAHQVVGALQAVLRVRQPDLVWVDWEPGPELAQALQQLPCELTGEAKAARMTLVNAPSADEGNTDISPATQSAALELLHYLEQHPSCAAG